jgi:ureidoacrylate peracid hydrolase
VHVDHHDHRIAGVEADRLWPCLYRIARLCFAREREIETLIFVGATTTICVESTVRDATFRDCRCIVLRDCTTELIAADTPRSNHEASLLAIELLFGWTAESNAIIGALLKRRAAAE